MIKFTRPLTSMSNAGAQLPLAPQLAEKPAEGFPAGYAEAKAACLAKCTSESKVPRFFAKYVVSMRELRAAYSRELKAFYKIRERANGTTRVFWEDWKNWPRAFARFLRDVGPSPGPDWKLRRIEQSKPLYAPHTVHWVRRGTLNYHPHDD